MPVGPNHIDELWMENRELKKNLGNLREDYQQLEYESSFNRIKATELQDIIAMREENDLQDKLVVKTLQNAEVNMEVQRLKQELAKANSCVLDLGKERDSSKRMLLELADIVRTLQAVEVDYETTSRESSYLNSQDASIRNIKRKVEAMIEDRKRLISRCSELQNENRLKSEKYSKLEAESRQKSQKILALEAQFHLLNSANISRGSSDASDASVTSHLTESVVSSISGSNIDNSQRMADTDNHKRPPVSPRRPPTKASADTHDIHDRDAKQKVHKTKQDEVSCASTAPESVSSTTMSSVNVGKVGTFEDSNLDEVTRLQAELDTEKLKYVRFKEICQSAFSRMGEVEDDLQKTKDALIATIKKRDVYKENLRDIINHYKELDGEHCEALDKIDLLEEELQIMVDDNVRMENEMHRIEDQKKELLQIRQDAKQQMLVAEGIYVPEATEEGWDALVEAYRRSEERIKTLERKLELAKREAASIAENKEMADRKLRDAIQKNMNLENEKAVLEDRIILANEESRFSRMEAQRQKEEAKHTRRRLTAYVNKTKKLETGQAILANAISKSDQMDNVDYDGILHRMLLVEMNVAVRAWAEKRKLVRERNRLDEENDQLKAFCEDVLNEVSTTSKSKALVRAV